MATHTHSEADRGRPWGRAPGAAALVLLATLAGAGAAERGSGTAAAPAAAERTVLHLTLAQCIEQALAHNIQVIQQRYQRQAAAVSLADARSAFLPSVSASYGLSRQLSGPREGSYVDEATGLLVTRLGKSHTSGSQSLGTSLSMTVYDRRSLASIEASRHALAAAVLDEEVTEQQVVFQTRQAYLSLLQAERLRQVQEEQIRAVEEDLRRAQTRYELRAVPISDVLTARASLESARASLIDRENQAAIARANLAFVAGLPPDAHIVPADTSFAVEPLGLTLEEAVRRALNSHPELRAQRETLLQAKAQLAGTRAGVRHPSVSIGTGYSWSLSDQEQFGGVEDLLLKNYGASFRVGVSLPIFNRMSTEYAVRTQTLNYRRSLAAFDQAKRQLELEVRQAVLNVQQYQRSIAANEAAVQAAEESARLAEERYSLGTGTFLERLQARSSLFAARNSLVQAIYGYHIQLAQLEQAIGGPLQPGATTTRAE